MRSPLAWAPTLRLLGAVLLVSLVGLGGSVLAILLVPGLRPHALVVLAASVPALSVLVVAVIARTLRRHGLRWRDVGLRAPGPRLLHLLWQLPALLVVLLAAQGLVLVATGVQPEREGAGFDELLTGVPAAAALALFLGIAVLVPFWEEVLFRGLLHGGFRRRFGVLPSAVLSGAAFAAAHGVPLLLPYFLALGVGFALLYEFHRTLWATVAAHVLLNTAVSAGALAAALQGSR